MANDKSQNGSRSPKLGLICFGQSKIDCTILSLSTFGAALDVASFNEKIPDEFTLLVFGEYIERRCAIVWRRDRRIAVVFSR
ncbi:PilZ domain-containing protein [Bradyrhizobium sp. JYMT SZCCT0428]|uniref:PilZ domain-containing protein n=1 Tax=Bradyrhizobium sp. JYMT SZCCT0428 TaxID=2807673 RepID=UPI001BABB9C7|nr:PilZ domain-containing protein [Bradyrhizobium sp. JYMT SZCCT0428]MBR1156271.1 PilZ domain-containing protein [Bradyrhizobium sp. JYMT SZCCT0428]